MSRAASQSLHIRKPAITSQNGLVSSQNRIASEIGANILSKGGNAIDAAIATSFALGVVEPWMSGIGGGGYMIIRRSGDNHAQVVDFGMRAPAELRPDDYPIVGGKASDLFPWPVVKDDANVFGAKAVAIPGQIAGMGEAHRAFGSLPWAELVSPAVSEAEKGLLVDWYAQLVLAGSASGLSKFPASKATYLDQNGFPKASAWTALGQTRCDQRALAATLASIAANGPKHFYKGPLADNIIAELRDAGGRHTRADFAKYSAEIVPASEFEYKGHKIFGTPHMTAGPTLERVFQLLSNWKPIGLKPTSEDFAKFDFAIRQANHERLESMGDLAHEPVPSCTTHFNVVDEEGTMVSVTQTLLSIFGSRMTLPNSGILMNNGIMWFDPEAGNPNSIGPGKRCLANMCPTLLERSDGARFGLGAAGGRKIMPAVAQLASFLLDYGMDPDEAIHEPRIDVSLDDITIADCALPENVKTALAKLVPSVTFAPRTTYPYNFACPSIVARQQSSNCGATEVMSYWADTVSAVA
ncbi:gamma-glutamyltransferase [Parasedimentitalea maritima]|uniref:Gamma-glutamyltransferase n=1 Tax=Parasedimentitalea maritima TaxID=2578117 RepID=A0A6A4RG35_9RHOB|nr:gamma-glutamyltransferase [Zongyanglinia marina]KAE9627969.1 gamma-glutamyltransferase [Zongyanglinia marina]